MPVQPGCEAFAFAGDGGGVGALLVHGFTGSPYSMRPWGEYLAEQGIEVLGPRLPGHGTRWQEMNLTRWQDWYGEVERGFDTLRGRCDDVFVMGLSMGGTLSLRLAEEKGDDLAGVVTVNASLLTERKDAKLLPLLAKVVPSVKAIGDDIKKPGMTEKAYDRTPLKAAESLAHLWRLVREELDRITQPLLLFRSVEDHVVEPASGALLLKETGSPDVREILLPDSYHVATLDNDAPTIFAESLAFVRAHTTARA
ncbi:MAG TPA: alpha/beta fold hydrolase [Mycobacteriales bacterium]|nr:alpha/beta fold hydrolase [Mycobacteriales bacterium]